MMDDKPYTEDSINLLPRWVLANRVVEFNARIEQLEALLRESVCPNTENDYKSIRRNGGWFCCAGKKSKNIRKSIEVSDKPCDFCKKRDELLTSQPHEV